MTKMSGVPQVLTPGVSFYSPIPKTAFITRMVDLGHMPLEKAAID